jgi:CheY-like chemotaxis protein
MTPVPHVLLVIEDDADSRGMLATLLTLEGYEVVTAANGLEGLAAARRHQPHLILLDLMMPVMDGTGFRQEQQQDLRIAGIPVICLSGHHAAASIAKSLSFSGCATKPIAFDDLLAMIVRVLER